MCLIERIHVLNKLRLSINYGPSGISALFLRASLDSETSNKKAQNVGEGSKKCVFSNGLEHK